MQGKLSIFLFCGVWAAAAQTPDFEREIQPILKNSCAACHSGDKAMGALRLDSRAAALADMLQAPMPGERPERQRYPDGLSRREVEVLQIVARGRTYQQIADELVLSQKTVARHISNIFDKTGAGNRTEAAAFALRSGLFQLQPG